MICAYDKLYLDKARCALGRMLDFAVYDLGYTAKDFFKLFISSGMAQKFERGDASITVGHSGVELAYLVLEACHKNNEIKKPCYTVNRSKEYWAGWALAYYQWQTALSFAEIMDFAPVDTIIDLYSPYHEMDIRHFCDKLDHLYLAKYKETKLKRLRLQAGLSQKELAQQSGIPLRTLQQYEQRQKSINNAKAESLVVLSQILGCSVKDLMERNLQSA